MPGYEADETRGYRRSVRDQNRAISPSPLLPLSLSLSFILEGKDPSVTRADGETEE